MEDLMKSMLRRLEGALHQQLFQRIAAMEALKTVGASRSDEWWEWKGVAIGLGAVWCVFARRLVTLTLKLL
jgi:hypothetical protein